MTAHSLEQTAIACPNAEQRLLQQNSLFNLATMSSEGDLGESSIQIPTFKSVATRPRAMSTGRSTRSVRSSTDLIQDVYDRLGVKRGALAEAADADHNLPSRLQLAERGRGRESHGGEDDKALRTRSLSRGRLVARWPPAEVNTEVLPSPKRQAARSFQSTNNDDDVTPPSPKQRLFRGIDDAASAPPASPKLRTFRNVGVATNMYKTNNSNKSTEWRINSSKSAEWRDEKKESDSISLLTQECDDEVPSAAPSVKDRMRAFSGSASNKKANCSPKKVPADKQYAAHFSVREHPPQIDIYEGEKNRDTDGMVFEEEEEDDCNHAISKHHLQQHKSMTSETSCSLPGKVASGFLATAPAINRYSYAPVREISSEDQASLTECVSMMSTGSEEQMSRHRLTNQGNAFKKPSWLERKPLSPYKSGTVHAQLSAPLRVGTSLSSISEHTAAIEKMVDERVRTRMSELERRMEDKLRTFMQQMEDKMALRMADLERNMR